MMSSLVSVDILPQFFWGSLGTGKKCCVLSSGSVVMFDAQMGAVGSVLSLLGSGTLSWLPNSARLGAVADFRYMDLMGEGPNSSQWSLCECCQRGSCVPNLL